MEKNELFEGLTPEQVKKAKACKSEVELLNLAKKEGVQLSDEQLEAVNGGCGTSDKKDDEEKVDTTEKNPTVNPF